MKSIVLLLIPLLFLSSCTIDWNEKKDAKIAELEKQVTELKTKNDDELFKKKQDCQKYKSKLEEEYKKNYSDGWDYLGVFTNRHISEVFYSKSENSCFSINYSVDGHLVNGKVVTDRDYSEIVNILTGNHETFDSGFTGTLQMQQRINLLKR